MKIAIVGAGTGGTKLINLFHEVEGTEVELVVDRNPECPGMERAKMIGIRCSADIGDIGPHVETIVEATGNEKVLAMLKERYSDRHIIDSAAAQLMMRIFDRQRTIADRLNFQLEEIEVTGKRLHGEMNQIVEVTSELNEINGALVNAANESKRFIEKSDEMIQAVNKLTQQIKILGLNANIEAARAGEHGRGFSVVATEVQKMSDSTSTFAGQISARRK
jgi:methyl-accepting chemotaxis protein